MSARPDDPTVRLAAVALVARASREPVDLVRCVLRRYGTADTIAIRDQVRRALDDETVTEAQVDLILAAEREQRRRLLPQAARGVA